MKNAEKNAKQAFEQEKTDGSYLFKEKFCLFLENKINNSFCFDEKYTIGKLIILPNFLNIEPWSSTKKYFKISKVNFLI